jgi:diacylglycerol O-acyltransferase / wax synthase
MRQLKQLTPREVLFVGGETRKIHQHTSGLTILDAGGRPDFGYESMRKDLEERLAHVPQFRWRLHEVPLQLDLPYWVEDADFSFDRHFRRIGVPAPGDREALGELVSYLYSRHLDRSHPLWEVWFIEGLAGGRYGLFTKLHHSMMDGQGANKLGSMICDLEPDAAPRAVDPVIADARPGEIPERWRESLTTARHLSGLPVRAGWELADGVRRVASRRLSQLGEPRQKPRVPTASFNCDIGADRAFVFGSLPLPEVKAVKNHFAVTLNDVVLALVAGSLRAYLLGRGELPEDSLRTSIAVSLRSDDDSEFSNMLTTAAVTLATTLDDPTERLRAIAEESDRAKGEARAGGKGFLEYIGLLPPALVNVVMSLTPAELVPRVTGFNMMISNVRGSPFPLYIGGARTTGMFPMSIITPGSGINVTCISYVDEVDFGFTLDPAVFSDPWPLVDALRDVLDAYLEHVPEAARPR